MNIQSPLRAFCGSKHGLTWAALAAFLVASAVSGQEVVRRDLGEVKVSQDRFQKLQNGEARTFRAFTIDEIAKDVGETVSRDTKVRTRSGRVIAIREALDQVNRLERALNRQGFSLRDEDRVFRLGRMRKDGALLRNQKRRLSRSLKPLDAFEPRARVSRLEPGQLSALPADAELSRVRDILDRIGESGEGEERDMIEVHPLRTASEHFDWRRDLGDPELLSVFVEGELDLQGSQSSTEARAEAASGASLLGKDVALARGTLELDCPAQGAQNVKMDISVAGQTVLSINQKYDDWSRDRSWEKALSTKGSFVVPIVPGIFNLKATLGIQGALGMGYEVAVSPLNSSARLEADASIEAFAEAAISAGVDGVLSAEAGAHFGLTLLEGNLDLVGKLSMNVVGSSAVDWVLDLNAYAYLDITMLDGEVDVYLEVTLPWPFRKYGGRYEQELFSFNGFSSDGYLFNVKKSIPLDPFAE